MIKTKQIILCCAVALPALTASLSAQDVISSKPGWQVRLGVMHFSPLVEDAVRSGAVADSIPAHQSDHITVQQQLAPTVALAVLYPLRPQFDLELSAAYASSTLQGEDDFGSWEVDQVGVANAVVGFGWRYRTVLSLHGGVGITRLFGSEAGLFAEGNGIRPMLEGGASLVMPFYRALRLDARLQTHSFSTATLRNEGSSDGNVLRGVGGISFTFGGRP